MENISRAVIFLVCFFAIEFAIVTPTAFSQQDTVLVKLEPPLTQGMVDRVVDFFQWSLGVHLSTEQKTEVRQSLVNSWKRNDRAEINGTMELLKLHSGLSALSDDQLNQARGEVRSEVLKSLRAQPNDKIAAMLLSLYESSSRLTPSQLGKSTAASQPAAPPAPVKVGAGDLYGIYIATTKQLVAPGAGSSVQYGITWQPGRDWITFLPGGLFFARLPNEGLAGFDYAKAVQKNPEAAGTYKIQGNTIRITWAASGTERVLKRTADGDLWEDKTNWTPLPKTNGMRLNGKYAVLWNEHSAKYHIRFTPDGRFEEFGMLKQINWDGYNDIIWDPKDTPRGNGTYNIYDNTLELRYSDGRVIKISFYVFPEELKKNSPKEIYINSFDFKLTQ